MIKMRKGIEAECGTCGAGVRLGETICQFCARMAAIKAQTGTTQRYTCTLGDGTALSVECADATEAHNIIAQYMGMQPTTGGYYIMYMRMRLADEWTKREISLAKRCAPKTEGRS